MNIADKLLKLKDYTGEDEVLTSTEMKAMADDEPHRDWFRSGFPTLDKEIEGFEAGQLIALSGPRKSGKTLLCQTLTKMFHEQGLASPWFSYELTPRQFFRAFDEVELPVFLMPRKNKAHDLVWLQDRILESISKFGVSVVFIDHLHFLFDLARVKNTSIEIGQVIRFLKGLAIDLNITIFVLCHMKKLQYDTEPSDTDFRDSSFVASESDTGLIIWRVKDSANQAWLKICYSRRTGAWEKNIPLMKTNGLLKEANANNDHI